MLEESLAEFLQSVPGPSSPWPILELVPHGLPMSLLDQVIAVSETALLAKVLLHKDSLFAEAEGVPALVGIEYMAQAIAAFAGHKALSAGGKVNLGFLVGTRKFYSEQSFYPIDQPLWVRVEEVITGDNGLSVFECVIKGAALTVSASLNVFQPKNPDEFLAQA